LNHSIILKTEQQLRAIKMVRVIKSAQDYELFGGTTLAPSGRALKNSKTKAILGRCAIFSPATAVFRIIPHHGKLIPAT
jgi:hypothetical protein